MKAFILLADAASAHPDGTFSLLRGGITEVNVPMGQALVFHGAFVVRIVGTLADAGQHTMAIKVITEDGKSVAPDVQGQFAIPAGGGATQVVASFNMVLPAYGKYVFWLSVDRAEADSWEMRVREPAAPAPRAPA